MNRRKAITIYQTKDKEEILAWCQFTEKCEVVNNAISQYSFIPTVEELELLNWSHYKEVIENILNNINHG